MGEVQRLLQIRSDHSRLHCKPGAGLSRTALRAAPCLPILVAIFPLLFCACSSESGPAGVPEIPEADLVLSGGSIFTGVAGEQPREAIALKDSAIAAVGSAEEVSAWVGPHTVVLDLAGRTVVPGFHDAHIHFYYGAIASLGLDLLLSPGLPLVLRAVQEYAAAHPEMEWILGQGWYFDTLPGGHLPSKADLDPLFPGRPVFLVHMSGHYAWVNSEALRRVGIDANTPDPPRGFIGRDPQTGEPDGILFEAAQALVYGPALAGIDPELKTQVLLQQLGTLNAQGITSIQEVFLTVGVEAVDLTSYLDLEGQGLLTCRINLFLSGNLDQEEIRGWKESLTGDRLRVAGLKVFVDGNFQGRTAWLLEPYADRPDSRGTQIYSQEELYAIARKGQCLGLPVKFHAIGDAAVRGALDAIGAAEGSCPPMAAKHSLEHIELLDPADLARFAALRAAASVQPVTAFFNTTLLAGSMRSAVGPERAGHLFANRSLKEAGTDVLFGTDWPAVPFTAPLFTLLAATVRTGETDPDFGFPPSPQAFSLEEALSAYTLLPARAIGRDGLLGTLERGKLADLVVLSADLLDSPLGGGLVGTKVDLTVMDGKIVFERSVP